MCKLAKIIQETIKKKGDNYKNESKSTAYGGTRININVRGVAKELLLQLNVTTFSFT